MPLPPLDQKRLKAAFSKRRHDRPLPANFPYYWRANQAPAQAIGGVFAVCVFAFVCDLLFTDEETRKERTRKRLLEAAPKQAEQGTRRNTPDYHALLRKRPCMPLPPLDQKRLKSAYWTKYYDPPPVPANYRPPYYWRQNQTPGQVIGSLFFMCLFAFAYDYLFVDEATRAERKKQLEEKRKRENKWKN